MEDRTPTLKDVATAAGVSPATVSRFFTNPDLVAAQTAERIRGAVAATGYIPNLAAGTLASSRSRLVAVLIPTLANSIFNETIEALSVELASAGVTAILGLTGIGGERTEEVVKAAISRRADAIITTGPIDKGIEHLLKGSKASVLQIWDLPPQPIDIAVGFSHAKVGREIARFVRSRGYERPHLITAEGARAYVRRDAFVAEWNDVGGSRVTESKVDIPSRFGHGRRAFAEIRRTNPKPDVVICGSDLLAQGLIVEALASGFKVPDDLAVIGFGNHSIAGEMRPTITTIDIDGVRIAREAIRLLHLRARDKAPESPSVDVGFRLIARESA